MLRHLIFHIETKKQLRRHGLISVANDPIERRNVLAVHHVYKNPGLSAVLNDLKRFRELNMKALVPVTKLWDKAPWQKSKVKETWLCFRKRYDFCKTGANLVL